MFAGTALVCDALPGKLVEADGIRRRLHDREGVKEVQFLWRDPERVLPVREGGRLRLVTWGNRRGEGRGLPLGGWVRLEAVDGGLLQHLDPVAVDIPATRLLDRGIWYVVRAGVRGVLVRDAGGRERVYAVCVPASHYHRVMTRSDWMPLLLGERI